MSEPQEEITEMEGDATINAEENLAVIEHGLSVTPNSISVTFPEPQNEYNSWVVNVNSTSFQVNLAVPVAQDIVIHWEAKA